MLCSCPSLLVALALLPFPESPKFLFEQGKNHEALEVLKRIYSSNTKRKSDDFPVRKIRRLLFFNIVYLGILRIALEVM